MELHRNVALCIFLAERDKQVSGVFFGFEVGNRFSSKTFLQNFCRFIAGAVCISVVGQAVVGNKAAVFNKIIEAFCKSGEHIVRSRDFNAGIFGKVFHIICKCRHGNVQRFIRAESGKHLDVERFIGGNRLVRGKVVHRVVGRANHVNVRAFNYILYRKLLSLKLFVAKLVNLARGVLIQRAVIAEITFQFEVTPDVHRIADK